MLDIIIPAYLPSKYHHRMLIRAIISLEQQTFKDFEVIVVLNGCYTKYTKIINSIDSSLKIRWETLDGKASGAIARNYGIKHSNAKLIAQLDVDDQYHPKKIEKQIKCFEQFPNFSFVGTLSWVYREINPYYIPKSFKRKLKELVTNPQKLWREEWLLKNDLEVPIAQKINSSGFKSNHYQKHKDIATIIKKENIICHGSVMFKRKDLLALGGYNETFKPGAIWPPYNTRMWEDWDLWQRAINAGYLFYNLPERLYYWSEGTAVAR